MEALIASEILAIPLNEPERLFEGNEDSAKNQYRKLTRRWHPDSNPGVDGTVLAHINALYDLALSRMRTGTWRRAGVLCITATDGRRYELKYTLMRPFALGNMYIGQKTLTYAITPVYRTLSENAVRMIEGIRFADSAMKAEHARYLPKITAYIKTEEGTVLVLRKDPEQICLRDVLKHYGGKIEPRHAAWILSSLYNLNCYLKFAGISHNDISPDTYFINPAQHNGALLGGWLFAGCVGQRLRALPERTHRMVPKQHWQPVATETTDSELLRLTLRELLGDPSGSHLPMDKDVPAPLVRWARNLAGRSAFGEYDAWSNKILPESFGPRRFVPMTLSATDVYKRN